MEKIFAEMSNALKELEMSADKLINKWQKEVAQEMLDNHDCHLSPEDSCDCQNSR